MLATFLSWILCGVPENISELRLKLQTCPYFHGKLHHMYHYAFSDFCISEKKRLNWSNSGLIIHIRTSFQHFPEKGEIYDFDKYLSNRIQLLWNSFFKLNLILGLLFQIDQCNQGIGNAIMLSIIPMNMLYSTNWWRICLWSLVDSQCGVNAVSTKPASLCFAFHESCSSDKGVQLFVLREG